MALLIDRHGPRTFAREPRLFRCRDCGSELS
jgi:hypothetical protein